MPIYKRILKLEIIKKSKLIKKAELDLADYFKNDNDERKKLIKLLKTRLDKFLNEVSENWDLSKTEPKPEDELEEFVNDYVFDDFINGNFELDVNDNDINILKKYIYRDENFDFLYDEIDEKIEDERNHCNQYLKEGSIILDKRILKLEIENTIEKSAIHTIDFVKKLDNDFVMKQEMNKILLKELDNYLNIKSEDWTFESDPDTDDIGDILDDFIKEEVTVEFINDNFNVKLSADVLDNLHDYIFNYFDDLYDEIDRKIVEECNLHDINKELEKDPYRDTGMSDRDFL